MLGNCYFDVKSIAFFTNMEFNKYIYISVEGIIPFDNMDLTNYCLIVDSFYFLQFGWVIKL